MFGRLILDSKEELGTLINEIETTEDNSRLVIREPNLVLELDNFCIGQEDNLLPAMQSSENSFSRLDSTTTAATGTCSYK